MNILKDMFGSTFLTIMIVQLYYRHVSDYKRMVNHKDVLALVLNLNDSATILRYFLTCGKKDCGISAVHSL